MKDRSILNKILNDDLKLHEDDGKPKSQTLPSEAFRFIRDNLDDGARTVETGNGLSTVVFTALGSDHISIAPDRPTFDRVEAYLKSLDSETGRLKCVEGYSEEVLPSLDLGEIDFALVDGGHGIFTTFIDTYYILKSIKIGGMLMIDDTWLASGHLLVRFLEGMPYVELIATIYPKVYVFKKVSDFSHLDWHGEPLNRSMSEVLKTEILDKKNGTREDQITAMNELRCEF